MDDPAVPPLSVILRLTRCGAKRTVQRHPDLHRKMPSDNVIKLGVVPGLDADQVPDLTVVHRFANSMKGGLLYGLDKLVVGQEASSNRCHA